jgi:glycosyltransferase involved in cell wall biosynthesis
MLKIPMVSLVVNTLNEERHIQECILSAKEYCSEIIVVDMNSDDATKEIAQQVGAKVYSCERLGYVEPARNLAISKATGDWILILDADERLKVQNKDLFLDFLKNSRGVDAFHLARHNQIFNRWLKGTGWGSEFEQHIRLFKRGSVHWKDEIHSVPIVDGLIGYLSESDCAFISHFNYKTIDEFVVRLNRYTSQESKDLANRGVKWDIHSMFSIPLEEFKNRFEPHKDDSHSAVLAGLMAAYKFIAWAKLWELQNYPHLPNSEFLPTFLKESLETKIRGMQPNGPEATGVNDGPTLLGFYEPDPEGWRWCAPVANINIPGGKFQKLSFSLYVADPSLYETFPISIDFIVNGKFFSKTDFKIPWEKASFHFDVPSDGFFDLRLKSTGKAKGGVDSRTLSFIMTNFVLR